jgi:hypothetical protein
LVFLPVRSVTVLFSLWGGLGVMKHLDITLRQGNNLDFSHAANTSHEAGFSLAGRFVAGQVRVSAPA